MTQRSLFWDGVITGDCGPYDEDDFFRFFRSLLNGTGDRGVLKGWLNELNVTGIVSPVTIATGGAVVDGALFENTESVGMSITPPSSGKSRYDRIVLRKNWSLKTVRFTRIVGTESTSPSIPALIQAEGVTYDIPLATVLIDDAGTLDITNDREWVTFSTQWPLNSVEGEDFLPGAVTAEKIPDRTRYRTLGAGQLKADSTDTPTWTAGGSYDYWVLADAVTESLWLVTTIPYDQAGTTLAIHTWNVPDVNGAGGGAENVLWGYDWFMVISGMVASAKSGTLTVDQQARLNTTVYRDLLVTITGATPGQILVLKITRQGGAGTDTYASDIRLLGVELEWTAEA